MKQKKGLKRTQRVVIVPTPDIQIVDQAAMFPHDAAALVRVTRKGMNKVIDILRRPWPKTPGYEITIADDDGNRIIFKLVREDE
jgi:hypothetical protein